MKTTWSESPFDVHGREVGVVLRNDGDDLAVEARRLEGRGDVAAAGGVVDHVEALAAGEARDVGVDRFRPIVDRVVGAEAACERGLLARGDGGGNLGTARLRELDRHMADPAGAAVHQHRLPRSHAGARESLPRGDGDQRQGRRLAQRERGRFGCEQARVGRDHLGVAAWHPAHAADAAIDLVALGEARDAVAHRQHPSGHVAAEYRRQRRRDRRAGLAQLVVGGVDAGRGHLHEHLAWARRRVGQGRGLEALGPAPRMDDLCLHRFLPL